MIKAIISDFDGTLVDTFKANLCAYQQAFQKVGLILLEEDYLRCFGMRFDDFMMAMKIDDSAMCSSIKYWKKVFYPSFFNQLVLNRALYELIASFQKQGGKTALASTATKENLLNAVDYLGICDVFTTICAGMDVKYGKPSPDIFLKAMEHLGVAPAETLIFEDSMVGIAAAKASGARVLRIVFDSSLV